MVATFIFIILICLASLIFYSKLWVAMDIGLAMAQQSRKSSGKRYTFIDEEGEQEHLPMVAETDEELDEEGFW